MNDEFIKYLKKGGRSANAIERILTYLQEFEQFLLDHRDQELPKARPEDLQAFVTWIEERPKTSAKLHLWALRYYFAFTGNDELRQLAGMMREQRIKRRPFPIGDFRGLDPHVVEKLSAVGINHVQHILKAGATPEGRAVIVNETGISEEGILEVIKLADLARIPGVKGIRARLYYDAGVDTLEELSEWEPDPLRVMLVDFVAQTGFDGIAPLPAEIRYSINQAKNLPKLIEY
jgi:hypothetical protein